MIEEFEARARLLETIRPSEAVAEIALADALGRVSAVDVDARVDLPGFDNSAMDGYAVRADEAKAGAWLRISGEQPAGTDLGLSLGPGEAIRLFTGAPLPLGADSVVMQEDTRRAEDGALVEIVELVERGEWIRRRGSEVCAGQRIFGACGVISPAALGLLASQGFSRVTVKTQPRIGIVTTGDEVIEPGAPMVPGQLYNSNGPMLEALVRQAGAIPQRRHAPDEPEELSRALEEALAANDFVVIAGGVSVGDRDFVKPCLTRLGVTADFWRVRVKPGKPFLFGRSQGEKPAYVFGLPGNPVSAFVTWHLFAGPAIARWMGQPVEGLVLPRVPTVAGRRIDNPGDRPHYARMRFEAGSGALVPSGNQRSDALFGLSQAEALLRLEAGQVVEEGEAVTAWRL